MRPEIHSPYRHTHNVDAGTIDEARSRIFAAVPRLKHLVQEGFDEIQDIVTLALQLGVKNIKVAPLLATNWDFHRDGALFESHHVRGKVRDVIAAGGRCVPFSSPEEPFTDT